MNQTKLTPGWKIVFLFIVIMLAVWLCLGDRGLVRLYKQDIEKQKYENSLKKIREDNRTLLEDIQSLRNNDTKKIEHIAREDLNLIKENEVIYRFKDTSDETPETNGQ